MGLTYGGRDVQQAGQVTVFVQETPVYDYNTYPPTLLGVSRSLVTGTDSTATSPIVFSGSFVGDATYLTVNNVSISQSVATATGLKAGAVSPAAFGGAPYSASVTFVSASVDSNYTVNLICQDTRAWSVQNITAAGFVIQTNSSFAAPTNDVLWSVIPHADK